MEQKDIPEEVLEGIKRVSEKRTIPVEKLIVEYDKIIEEKKVQRQTGGEEAKAIWAGKILFNRFMSKEPVTTYKMLIPFGTTEPRLKKDAEDKIENMRATMFAAVEITKIKDGKKVKSWEVKEMVFNGKYATMVRNIKMIRAYSNVKLYDKGYFIEVGDGTKFDAPQKLRMSEEDFITKICKLPKLDKLSDVITHKSRIETTGYADKTDMYLIEGMVVRGFKKGYAIKDESLEYEERVIKVAGENIILPQTLTVWIPSRFYKWDEDSELAFVGTISIGQQDNKPVMNAVLAYPAGFVCELPEGGKKEKEKVKEENKK
ncbi:hypothetical protein KAW18_12770 [candidate division WOR-3 bacterium]|nr:hypothetical protein [candidate division WOR-3 bacterium]